MNKTASIDSRNNPNHAVNHSLHPVLKTALGSLNIQLDEELARYRRRRRSQEGAATASQPAPLRPTGKPKSLDLQFLNTVSSQAPNSPATKSAAPIPTPTPQRRPTPPVHATPIETVVVQSSSLSQSPLQEYQETPPASPGLVLASHATELAQPVMPPISHLAHTPTESEDPYRYFESSQELLRSLSEEEGHTPIRRRRAWLNPLGIGSFLLLLLTSASLGYVLMNTLKSRQLGLQQTKAPTIAPSPQQVAPTALPTSPDLTAKEFVDLNLNTLGTLPSNNSPTVPLPLASPSATGLTSNVAASPIAALKPGAAKAAQSAAPPQRLAVAPTAAPREVPTVAVPVAPVAPVRPAPVQAAPPRSAVVYPPQPSSSRRAPTSPRQYRPQPEARPSAPVQSRVTVPSRPQTPAPGAPPATAAAPKYRVVVPFNGDQALEQVRQTDPRAFVRNSAEGAKIQVGAYEDEANARQRVQELQEKGIEAQIVPR